jgi:hypothetical protein
MNNLPEPVQYAILSFGIAILMIATFFIHSTFWNMVGVIGILVLFYQICKKS